MEKCILDYLAKCVMDDLRAGTILDEQFARALNARPQIDHLRSQVTVDDAALVVDVINSRDDATKWLGVALTKRIIHMPAIRELLHGLWRSTTDYETRYNIMWRLLDDPTLETEWHQEIYEFVRENWTMWLKDTEPFHAKTGDVLVAVEARLVNSEFAESKNWVYLCLAVADPRVDRVKTLLTQYIESDQSIVATVAKDMLARLR